MRDITLRESLHEFKFEMQQEKKNARKGHLWRVRNLKQFLSGKLVKFPLKLYPSIPSAPHPMLHWMWPLIIKQEFDATPLRTRWLQTHHKNISSLWFVGSSLDEHWSGPPYPNCQLSQQNTVLLPLCNHFSSLI